MDEIIEGLIELLLEWLGDRAEKTGRRRYLWLMVLICLGMVALFIALVTFSKK